MTEEEYFRKNYPNACYGDRLLSPYWDYFQEGVEFGEQKLEQTEKDLADYQFNYPTIKELQKENEELRKKLKALEGQTPWKDIKDKSEVIGKLTAAKELLKKFCTYYMYDCDETRKDYETFEKLKEQAEKFLKEVEE